MEISGYTLLTVAFITRCGVMWSARSDSGLNVLILLRSSTEGTSAKQRWERWKKASTIHVVKLLDVVHHIDNRWLIVMERVYGQTLETLMDRQLPRTLNDRLRILDQVRAGLEDLHRVGIVHADLTPGNIIINEGGDAVLIDIADEPSNHYGTKGWSEGEGEESSDKKSWIKLCHALLGDKRAKSITWDTPLKYADSDDIREKGYASNECGEDIAVNDTTQTFRLLASSEGTRNVWKEPRHSVPKKRRRGLIWKIITCAGLFCGGLWLIYAIASDSRAPLLIAEQSNVIHTADQEIPNKESGQSTEGARRVQNLNNTRVGISQNTKKDIRSSDLQSGGEQKNKRNINSDLCVNSENAQKSITKMLQRRDRALISGNLQDLSSIESGPVLKDDEDFIRSLKERDLRIQGLHTQLHDINVQKCDEEEAIISIVIQQDAYERCTQDMTCTAVDQQKEHRVTIYIHGIPWKIADTFA